MLRKEEVFCEIESCSSFSLENYELFYEDDLSELSLYYLS